MKRNVNLPTLQIAATAFLATTCQAAADVYCVEKATSEVVATENCLGEDTGDFAVVEGHPGEALGTIIERRDSGTDEDKVREDMKAVLEFGVKIRQSKLVTGGFGRRGDTCDCHASGGYRGGIGAGGVFVGGVGRTRGGSSRGG